MNLNEPSHQKPQTQASTQADGSRELFSSVCSPRTLTRHTHTHTRHQTVCVCQQKKHQKRKNIQKNVQRRLLTQHFSHSIGVQAFRREMERSVRRRIPGLCDGENASAARSLASAKHWRKKKREAGRNEHTHTCRRWGGGAPQN